MPTRLPKFQSVREGGEMGRLAEGGVIVGHNGTSPFWNKESLAVSDHESALFNSHPFSNLLDFVRVLPLQLQSLHVRQSSLYFFIICSHLPRFIHTFRAILTAVKLYKLHGNNANIYTMFRHCLSLYERLGMRGSMGSQS